MQTKQKQHGILIITDKHFKLISPKGEVLLQSDVLEAIKSMAELYQISIDKIYHC